MVDSESSSMATVIEGTSVGIALEESNRLVFLELCQYCRAVVCCRVSPIQKAQVSYMWSVFDNYDVIMILLERCTF
jgi:magnesium-transporting ATPase (P-type)